jgi:hypothetical protein
VLRNRGSYPKLQTCPPILDSARPEHRPIHPNITPSESRKTLSRDSLANDCQLGPGNYSALLELETRLSEDLVMLFFQNTALEVRRDSFFGKRGFHQTPALHAEHVTKDLQSSVVVQLTLSWICKISTGSFTTSCHARVVLHAKVVGYHWRARKWTSPAQHASRN